MGEETSQGSEPGPYKLYFGYGSNLWLEQMALRCPSSVYVGMAVLHDWRWIINQRGYATILPSPGDIVFGAVYTLIPPDEERLDKNEGVPFSYVKKMLKAEITWAKDSDVAGRLRIGGEKSEVEVLVYVDEVRIKEGVAKEEYVWRMNSGIRDAVERGMPVEYAEEYLRPFIRAEEKEVVERTAVPRVVA